jgi:hypothetical protein
MLVAVDALRMAVDKHKNRCAALATDKVTGVHSQIIPLIPRAAGAAFTHPVLVCTEHSDELLKHASHIIDLIAGAHCS